MDIGVWINDMYPDVVTTVIIIAGADLGIFRGWGVFWAGILQRGGGGGRVQVRGNFHILHIVASATAQVRPRLELSP